MSVISARGARCAAAVLRDMAGLSGMAGKAFGTAFSGAAFFAATLAVLSVPAAPAMAQAPSIALELNAAKSTANACRMSFLFRNDLAAEIGDLALEVVFFNADGLVERFFVLKSGRLPRGKSRVRQFDMPQITCDGISRILVNDVAACEGEALTPQSCLDALNVTSRGKIAFGL